jgi:hypothetical protein
MAIGANSYGSVAGVAALAVRWTNAGAFDGTTKPTLTQVESWIDQISAAINLTMAECRYTTLPITIDTITDSFDMFVNQMVADIVEGSHDIGRLGPSALTNPNTGSVRSMWKLVFGEVATYIKDHCNSFEYLGLPRDPINNSKGRMKTSSLVRADGYSNDDNAIETTGL